MAWTDTDFEGFGNFSKAEVVAYKEAIDCADLAIHVLFKFAQKIKKSVKLKYYSGGWQYLSFDPKQENFLQKVEKAKRMLGALNVIDNTEPINIANARAGDLIMSKWDSSLGHTRIIDSVTQTAAGEYYVVWYQGNLPPVVPEKRESLFKEIDSVYGSKPRRWRYKKF